MKTLVMSLCLVLLTHIDVFAQVAVNADGSAPDNSAMLDVSSTNRGLLMPRISTVARDLIPSPASGLIIQQQTGLTIITALTGVSLKHPLLPQQQEP